jgi:hypothetical protein
MHRGRYRASKWGVQTEPDETPGDGQFEVRRGKMLEGDVAIW